MFRSLSAFLEFMRVGHMFGQVIGKVMAVEKSSLATM
jgi:hypothetical protein